MNSSSSKILNKSLKKLTFLLIVFFLFFSSKDLLFAQSDDFFRPRDSEAENSQLPVEDDEEEEEAEVQVIGSNAYNRYGKYLKEMRDICVLMHFDGRRAEYLKIVEENNVKDPNCASCKNLFKMIKSACKDSPKLKKELDKRYLELHPPSPSPSPGHSSEEDIKEDEVSDSKDEQEHEGEEKAEEDAHMEAKKEDVQEMEFLKQREPNPEMLSIISESFSELAKEKDSLESIVPSIDKLKAVLESPEGKTKGEQEYFTLLASYIYSPFLEYVESKKREEKRVKKQLELKERQMSVDDLFDFQ
ncbi:MAG: hypothetical protein KDD56_01070 [Bdellovibrionales bacterium]|nr:hypothetical protein [Bdellovibrionales bacterium]